MVLGENKKLRMLEESIRCRFVVDVGNMINSNYRGFGRFVVKGTQWFGT